MPIPACPQAAKYPSLPGAEGSQHSRAFDRARRLRQEQNETIRCDLLYDPGKTVSEALIGMGKAGARLPDIQARLHIELFRAMLEELMSGRLPAGSLVEPEG